MAPTAEDLIVARAERDLDDGIAHAMSLLRAGHSRPVGAALAALVGASMRTLHLRERIEIDSRYLLTFARRLDAREPVERLVAEAWPELVRRRRLHLVVREKDPEYPPAEREFLAFFALRLPDLARLARVTGATSYDDLVRRAFPDRAEVDAMVTENGAFAHATVARFEAHPHLLRVPAGMVPKLAATAREFVDWQVAKIRRGVDEIYGLGKTGSDSGKAENG